MSGRKIEVLVAIAMVGATLAVVAPAGAQAASSHPAMAKKAAHTQQGTVKVKEASSGLAAQATLSADSAQKIALAQVPHGWVREAELEQDSGTLVYSYDIKARGKSGVEEVLVDAKTGAVVSTKKAEARDPAADAKPAKAPKAKAAKPAKSMSNTPKAPATQSAPAKP